MNKQEYFAIIADWHKRYGIPEFGAGRYDPTAVSTCCGKCGKMAQHMSRHHKANDFFFALHFPDLYAKRYIQFLPEDCVKLCDDCHKSVHLYYKALTFHLYDEFEQQKSLSLTIEEWQVWCEDWKEKFRSAFKNWMSLHYKRKHKKHKKKKSSSAPKREVEK